MTARLKGRRREVQRLLADLTGWAQHGSGIDGLAMVGSYARGHERMASDVDVVVLLRDVDAHPASSGWFGRLRPGSRLVRRAAWGPVREQRYRLRSGLHVEVGFAPTSWAGVPLDPGTRRVLADGHRILHDPECVLARARAALSARPCRAAGAPRTEARCTARPTTAPGRAVPDPGARQR